MAFKSPQLLSDTPQVNTLRHFLTEDVKGVRSRELLGQKVLPRLDSQGQAMQQLWRPGVHSRAAAEALSAAQGIQAIFRMAPGEDSMLEPTGVTYILSEVLKHEEAKMQYTFEVA